MTDRLSSHPLATLTRCQNCGERAVQLVRRGFKIQLATCMACGVDWKAVIEEMEERYGV